VGVFAGVSADPGGFAFEAAAVPVSRYGGGSDVWVCGGPGSPGSGHGGGGSDCRR